MATAKKKASAASAGSKAKDKAKAETPKSKVVSKAAPAKAGKKAAKPAKAVKPAAKPAKAAKPAAKPAKAVKPAAKPAKAVKPAAKPAKAVKPAKAPAKGTSKASKAVAKPVKAAPAKVAGKPKKAEAPKAAPSAKPMKAPKAVPSAKPMSAKPMKVAPAVKPAKELPAPAPSRSAKPALASVPVAKKSRKSVPAVPPSRKSVSRLPTLRSLVSSSSAAAKPEPVTFKVHDLAVHPSHGVGEVVAIEQKAIGGGPSTEFYVLLVQGGSKVIVPVRSAQALGLRQVMTADEADAILDTIRSKEVAVKVEPWSRRFRIYQEMVKSKSLHEVAKVMRDMHRLRGSKNLSFGEQNLLDKAKGLLLRELSLAKRVSESDLEGQLEAALAS